MKYFNLNRDVSMGGETPSHLLVSSQKAIKTYVDDVASYKEDSSCKITSVDASSDDIHFPSAKAVYDAIMLNSSKASPILYSELKGLRDTSTLSTGKFYRITDFVTTTNGHGCENPDTITDSANHSFDLIVIADSPNSINETAIPSLHDSDTYFQNSQLSKWELKYTLDNDVTKYSWADTTNGKGVIYHMKDDKGNEAGYDFKNIRFKRKWNSTALLWSDRADTGSGQMLFTFSSYGDETVTTFEDISVTDNYVRNNILKNSSYNGAYALPDICFMADSGNTGPRGNIISEDSNHDTISGGAVNNIFGNGFSNNIIYDGFNNVFGPESTNNTVHTGASDNEFGNGCESNVIGSYASGNIFGSECCFNVIGSNCERNIFLEDASGNILGDSCMDNKFGSDTEGNIMGNDCKGNEIGNGCINNVFASDGSGSTYINYLAKTRLENGVSYNIFWAADSSEAGNTKNYLVKSSVIGTDSSSNTIAIKAGNIYDTIIFKDSGGIIRQKRMEDLGASGTVKVYQVINPRLEVTGGKATWIVENRGISTLVIAQVCETATNDTVKTEIRVTDSALYFTMEIAGQSFVSEGILRATIFYCETEAGEAFQSVSPILTVVDNIATWTVTNEKGTTLAMAQVFETDTGDIVNANIKMTNNNIIVTFNMPGVSTVPAGKFTLTVL